MCDIMYNYLPHPSNMRTSSHVLRMRIREGAAGYGVYMMLLELLRDADNRRVFYFAEGLAYAINERDIDLVKRVCEDYGLFSLDKEAYLSSPWLDGQMAEYDAKKQAAVEAGRRGAAKRYGKVPDQAPDMTKDENPEQVPYGDPIGGGMGGVEQPHANNTNITNITNHTNETNQSKSKLLSLSWGSMDGQSLVNLVRAKGPALSKADEDYARKLDERLGGGRGKTYYAMAVYNLSALWNLTSPVFHLLLEMTHNGHQGTEGFIRMRKVYEHCKKTKFTPAYPAEYLICKMLEK